MRRIYTNKFLMPKMTLLMKKVNLKVNSDFNKKVKGYYLLYLNYCLH